MDNVQFDCDTILNWYDYENSPWGENREKIYELVKLLRPKKIVELGSYLGCSTFTFAQSCKDNHIPCEIYAIDTWEGDEHSGFYGEEIYSAFTRAKDVYPFERIHVIREKFDDALSRFPARDIDILHIDGLHTYEAVKNDFQKWAKKVKKGGIILIHDIVVEGYGTSVFWKEIKKKYETEEINNKNGLGLIYL